VLFFDHSAHGHGDVAGLRLGELRRYGGFLFFDLGLSFLEEFEQ
jgi:hypothetical protein